MNTELLNKYAELIVRSGANVQQGQKVIIYASTEQADLVERLAEKAYLAGAVRVDAEWSNQALTAIKSRYESIEMMSGTSAWEIEKLKEMVEDKPCEIHILSDDPDGMKNADTNKILGCSLFGPETSEIINIVSIVMKTGQEYTFLRDYIFTHPSMSEALNDLMNF